jgi:hypothetical protein
MRLLIQLVIPAERSESRDPVVRVLSIDCDVLGPRFRGDDNDVGTRGHFVGTTSE